MAVLSFKRVPVLALSLAMMSVPALAQKVDVDVDKSVNFRAFKTYAIGTINLSEDTSPLQAQRVVSAIERHMSLIGFQKVEKAPEVLVTIKGTTREELVYYSPWGVGGPYYWGGPYWWGGPYAYGWGGGYVDVQRILIGTLIVDMVDTKTDRVFLRGTAEKKISSKAHKNERHIYEGVAEIFEESPWGADFDDD